MRLYLVQRSPGSNYIIRGTDFQGNKVFQSTKTSDKGAAEAKRVKLEALLLKESVHGKKAVITFDQAAETYLANGGSDRFLGDHNPKTDKWDGLMGKLFGVELRSITQSYIDQIAKELHPNVKPATLNRIVYTPFVAVWNAAVGNEWAEDRRWRRPSRKKKGTRQALESKTKRVGSFPTTYERAVKFVLGMSPANAIVMTILFYTGMRPIELFCMHSDQVNVKKRWIVLPASKIGEARGVPIHRFLVPLLTALKKRGGMLVRTWEHEAWTVVEGNGGQMKKGIANARSRTGIRDISPNTARHTVSTQLVVNGIHPHMKDQILGHAVDDMSRNYTDVPRPELIKAIETLPIFPNWAAAKWMKDPIKYEGERLEPLTPAQKAKLPKAKAA
jgi:integrase/recombinase XerD